MCHFIAPNRRHVCASPAFIEQHGLPENSEQLATLPCIALRENNEDVTLWHFTRSNIAEGRLATTQFDQNKHSTGVLHSVQGMRESLHEMIGKISQASVQIESATQQLATNDWNESY